MRLKTFVNQATAPFRFMLFPRMRDTVTMGFMMLVLVTGVITGQIVADDGFFWQGVAVMWGCSVWACYLLGVNIVADYAERHPEMLRYIQLWLTILGLVMGIVLLSINLNAKGMLMATAPEHMDGLMGVKIVLLVSGLVFGLGMPLAMGFWWRRTRSVWQRLPLPKPIKD
jgi:hypothetical protein